ncbi:hypothetical protein RCZ04_21070 [Capnocytophaga sp. HP1101]
MKNNFFKIAICLIGLLVLQACSTVDSHRYSDGKKAVTKKSANVKTGAYKTNVTATYYHDKFNGKKTASGAVFSNSKLTTAHPSLPFGTKLKVTNRVNGKSVIVTVTDRGPFTKGRELDLTKRAFMEITESKNKGLIQVDIEIVE